MVGRLPLICPLDGLALERHEGSLLCGSGHCFDIAKQGYVNLLPVQHKASLNPGDSPSMVEARRRVMAAGVFQPLADAVTAQVVRLVERMEARPVTVLDAGCGEGFYTDHMHGGLVVAGHEVVMAGVDISKPAIVTAAKRYPDIEWLVASNKRLPVGAGVLDGITSIFGFPCWEEWAALQTKGQFVVLVDAGPRHLIELRELIYDEVQIHAPPAVTQALLAGYVQAGEVVVSYAAEIEGQGVCADILHMTPHGHRAPAEVLAARLGGFEGTVVTVEAVVRVLKRV